MDSNHMLGSNPRFQKLTIVGLLILRQPSGHRFDQVDSIRTLFCWGHIVDSSNLRESKRRKPAT